jgi:hypothetical protein
MSKYQAWSGSTPLLWNDLEIPLISSNAGSLNPPTLEKMVDNGAGSEGVWAYSFNDAATAGNEKSLLFSRQMPHDWKEGTAIHAHIHWAPSTTDAGNVKWGLEYTIQDVNGGAFPTTTIITGTAQAAGGVALAHKVQAIGVIDMTGKKISAVILGRVFRNSSHASDTYAEDAFGISFDFHYQRDAEGSRQEYAK